MDSCMDCLSPDYWATTLLRNAANCHNLGIQSTSEKKEGFPYSFTNEIRSYDDEPRSITLNLFVSKGPYRHK